MFVVFLCADKSGSNQLCLSVFNHRSCGLLPSLLKRREKARAPLFPSPLNMLFALSSGAAKQVVYTNRPGLLCLFPFLSWLRRRPPGPVFRPGDRPFSPSRRPVFPPIFPGFAILVILLTKRSIIGFFEDFKKQSFLVRLSLIFLFLHEKTVPSSPSSF